MKKTCLTLALLASFAAASAQAPAAAPGTTPALANAAPALAPPAADVPADYAALLAQTIADITHTGDPATLAALAAQLERAATVAPADWLPPYYQAYALVISVFQSKESGDAKDQTLDRAEAAIMQARRLRGDESELLTLQAYAYQARLGISPVLRGLKYAGLVTEAVAQAEALNPANPRPYLVAANNVYYTPAMFGGGADKAKPLYEAAQVKFAAFRPAGPLQPSWGQGQVRGRLRAYGAAPAPAATPRGN